MTIMSNDQNNPKPIEEMNADVSAEERALLDKSIDNGLSQDDTNLTRATLDNKDEDGVLLNGASNLADFTGDELDVPGAELDDENESLGSEDEENNSYSQADTE